MSALVVGIGLLNIILLYRRITSIGKITVSLWIGVLLTVGAVIATGMFNFDPTVAFAFPPNAFQFTWGFMWGLGAASRVGIYDYLGYYDVCYIGDEVKDPGKVIPRSIFLSIVGVAGIYLLINLSIIGVIPWREFVPYEKHPNANFIVSFFMERVYGSKIAALFTLMILWTAFGSCFALLLGYSRIPFAAAQEGYFFRIFSRLHPKGNFPHLSLLSVGLLAVACSFLTLQAVIDALLTTRIVVQFIGQIGAVMLLRRYKPDMPRPYRIWLYPVPCLIALIGWGYLLATTPRPFQLHGLYFLLGGLAVFFVWSWRQKSWPFVPQDRISTSEHP